MLVIGSRPAAGNGDAAALAATAYRGLLLALPASTALWFGDLRDRGTAAAVESYTRAEHSPVLLAIPDARILEVPTLEPLLYDASGPVTATREFIRDPRGTAEYLTRP